MKGYLNLAIVAGLALASAGAAQAQSTGNLLGSGDIKVGIFAPSSSTDRDNSNNSQISVGADYTFPSVPGAPRPTVYGDYQGGSKNNGHVNTVGIGIAEKFVPPVVGSVTHINPYGGIGIGVYRTDVNNHFNSESGTNTSIGGKVFAGLNFNKWLLEANYQWIPSTKSVDPKGFGVQVGLTF